MKIQKLQFAFISLHNLPKNEVYNNNNNKKSSSDNKSKQKNTNVDI